MRFRGLAALAALCVFSLPAGAAGLQRLEVPANGGAAANIGAVWYPCAEAPGLVPMRRVTVRGVKDCPVKGEKLPLVVISHGFNGWFGGHHDTAAALADAGFVVAAITHTEEFGRAWQSGRPAAIKRLIDHMLGGWPERGRIDASRIGFFGFSRGGYTGLVLVGGVPDFWRVVRLCQQMPRDPICRPASAPRQRSGRPAARPKPVYTHDPRIKAAVIAAPLGVVFGREQLKAVTVPIQLWGATKDERATFAHNADAVAKALPRKPDFQFVETGHFAFLAPCSEGQAKAVPALCHDADGFDRTAFHVRFNAAVVTFFRTHLR